MIGFICNTGTMFPEFFARGVLYPLTWFWLALVDWAPNLICRPGALI